MKVLSLQEVTRENQCWISTDRRSLQRRTSLPASFETLREMKECSWDAGFYITESAEGLWWSQFPGTTIVSPKSLILGDIGELVVNFIRQKLRKLKGCFL